MSAGGVIVFASHPEVVVDPAIAVPDWGLSELGRARAAGFARSPICECLAAIWTSPERKARDTAAIAAEIVGLAPQIDAGLAEIDREAVGFVPEPRFSALRDRFFQNPDASPDGWERAVDAQVRILAALDRVHAATVGLAGDVLVVSHGGVGALALAARRRSPIALDLDQPRQGCWFAYAPPTGPPAHTWREMPDP